VDPGRWAAEIAAQRLIRPSVAGLTAAGLPEHQCHRNVIGVSHGLRTAIALTFALRVSPQDGSKLHGIGPSY